MVNIPDGDVSKGQQVVPFQATRGGVGPQRHVLLLFIQSKALEVPQGPQNNIRKVWVATLTYETCSLLAMCWAGILLHVGAASATARRLAGLPPRYLNCCRLPTSWQRMRLQGSSPVSTRLNMSGSRGQRCSSVRLAPRASLTMMCGV